MLDNRVLISIFELGPEVTKIVTTETFRHCFGSDKREHPILIFGGNKKKKGKTVMQLLFFFS